MRYLIFLWWALLASALVMLHFHTLYGICLLLVAYFFRLTLPDNKEAVTVLKQESKLQHRLRVLMIVSGVMFLNHAGIFDQIAPAFKDPGNRFWYFLFVVLLLTREVVDNMIFFKQVSWKTLEQDYDL